MYIKTSEVGLSKIVMRTFGKHVLNFFLFLRFASYCVYYYTVFGFRQSQLYFSNIFLLLLLHTPYTFRPLRAIFRWDIYIYWSFHKVLFSYNGPVVFVFAIDCTFFRPVGTETCSGYVIIIIIIIIVIINIRKVLARWTEPKNVVMCTHCCATV
jgi:hypothetical protein